MEEENKDNLNNFIDDIDTLYINNTNNLDYTNLNNLYFPIVYNYTTNFSEDSFGFIFINIDVSNIFFNRSDINFKINEELNRKEFSFKINVRFYKLNL